MITYTKTSTDFNVSCQESPLLEMALVCAFLANQYQQHPKKIAIQSYLNATEDELVTYFAYYQGLAKSKLPSVIIPAQVTFNLIQNDKDNTFGLNVTCNGKVPASNVFPIPFVESILLVLNFLIRFHKTLPVEEFEVLKPFILSEGAFNKEDSPQAEAVDSVHVS